MAQADLLEILATLANGDDDELKTNAVETLRSQDYEALEQSIRANDAPPSVLAFYSGEIDLPQTLHEAILTNAKTPASAIAKFAATTPNGSLLELVSINQQLLIQNPAIIDAIIANPNRTPEAERRRRRSSGNSLRKNAVPSRSPMSCGPVRRLRPSFLSVPIANYLSRTRSYLPSTLRSPTRKQMIPGSDSNGSRRSTRRQRSSVGDG